MNIVLCGFSNCEGYLDDIVAYSSTWTEHLRTLSEIFHRLRDASLTLNLAKCEFGKAIVSLGRLSIPGSLQISQLPKPDINLYCALSKKRF